MIDRNSRDEIAAYLREMAERRAPALPGFLSGLIVAADAVAAMEVGPDTQVGPCEHDLSEREVACADGVCPICSNIDLAATRKRLEQAEALLRELLDETDFYDWHQRIDAFLSASLKEKTP